MRGYWTCQRVTRGEKCSTLNPNRKRICDRCGKKRQARRLPGHMVALDQDYGHYVRLNGGEECGICGVQGKTRRLHRDHDHRTGEPRGLLCFRDNSALRPYMTAEWLWSAWRYLVRSELMAAERLQWNIEDRGHDTPCWIWQRALHSAGYGVIHYQDQVLYVHRIMHRGPIPEGYHVDHLCRQKACVNPAHLEAVTPAENVRRAADVETCKRGHLWTEENTYRRPDNGIRQCRACIELRWRAAKAA